MSLAMNVANPQDRERQMAAVFQPVIEFLQNPQLTEAFASPVAFFNLFNGECVCGCEFTVVSRSWQRWGTCSRV